MKYPKLAAAIDDLLSKKVNEQGEDLLTMAVEWAIAATAKPVEEKQVDIPVTKELILSKQTEVREPSDAHLQPKVR